MKTKSTIIITLLLFLAGCLPYPARTVMPLRTRVVDAASRKPIQGAQVLRIVCDVHDFNCRHAKMDQGQTDSDGFVRLSGEREWGLWIPAPGGIPVPNHQIAIWKEGYYAFVYSQYGNIEDLRKRSKRQDIIEAINRIPPDRKKYGPNDHPEEMFSGGLVKLIAYSK